MSKTSHHLSISIEETANPIKVIEEFFNEDYHLSEAIQLLQKWLRTAFSEEKKLSRKGLLSVLYFQERLTILLDAVYLLNETNNKIELEEVSFTKDSRGITNVSLYYSDNMTHFNAWHAFPRHLSEKEYNNPFRVLEKCFHANTPEEWKNLLQQLFIGASHENSVYQCHHNKNIYTDTLLLFKLIEACHLIKVREIDNKKE